MAYFPMFVDLSGKEILVVGGGKIAERRIRTLLEFGCRVTVVAPEVSEGLRKLCEEGQKDLSEVRAESSRSKECCGEPAGEKENVRDGFLEAGENKGENLRGKGSEICVRWKKKTYDAGDLKPEEPSEDADGIRFSAGEYGFFFVLAAAPPPVNDCVVRDCRERKIPVNHASDRDQCDFYFPGIAKNGETVVGITSGGSDHKKAARISGEIREILSTL